VWPHRVAALEADGVIRFLPIVCLPHHASFDRSAEEGDVDPDHVLAEVDRLKAFGGMLQVMNHPDINAEPLFEILGNVARHARFDAPAGTIVDWWRASHLLLESTVRSNGHIELKAPTAVEELAIEMREPDGAVREVSTTLAGGETSTIS
jgi:hypothetical protein